LIGALSSFVQAKEPSVKVDKESRVLMIGHSFFACCGGMHNILAEVLESKGYEPTCEYITGSMGIAVPNNLYSERSEVRAERYARDQARFSTVIQKPWDYVVAIGGAYGPNYKGQERMNEEARLLVGKVKERNPDAKVILYLNHAKRGELHKQDAYSAAYREAAEVSGSMVTPAGEAWRLALQERPDLLLHRNDQGDNHPGFAGSYLSACTIFATLTGETPVGAMTETKKEYVCFKLKTPFAVEKETGDFLQEIAWRAYQEEDKGRE